MSPLAGLGLSLLLAGSPHQFTLDAAQGRLDTGLFVRRGELLKVKARGAWTMWAGKYGLSSPEGHRYRVGLYGWGCLLARIGSGVEVSVGTHRTWNAPDDGQLVMYPNTGALGERGGSGTLTIEVEGGTPVTEVIDRLASRGVRLKVPADQEVVAPVYVNDGDSVRIDAFGEWRMFDGGALLTADGDRSRLLYDGVPWGRLVARFGGPAFASGETYPVGAARDVRAKRGGLLTLFAATGPYEGLPRNGVLDVVVRGGQPATPELRRTALRRATDAERALGFLRIHEFRYELRLPSPFGSPALMRAAQAHAEYLANQDGGHDEQPGQPGFTGATPEARVAATGFDGRLAGEMIHGYDQGQRALDGLWATVYHRYPLLDPAATAYGVGIAKGRRPVCVVLAGIPKVQPVYRAKVPDVVTYPESDQVYVPISWNGLELPSPLPAGVKGPVGYPISLTLTKGDIDQVVEATLSSARGVNQDVWVISPADDPHKMLRASVFLVPKHPLPALESYVCRVVVATANGNVTTSWRFTTSDVPEPFVPRPRLDNPANPVIELGR